MSYVGGVVVLIVIASFLYERKHPFAPSPAERPTALDIVSGSIVFRQSSETSGSGGGLSNAPIGSEAKEQGKGSKLRKLIRKTTFRAHFQNCACDRRAI